MPIAPDVFCKVASGNVQRADGIEFSECPATLKVRFPMHATLANRAQLLCKAGKTSTVRASTTSGDSVAISALDRRNDRKTTLADEEPLQATRGIAAAIRGCSLATADRRSPYQSP